MMKKEDGKEEGRRRGKVCSHLSLFVKHLRNRQDNLSQRSTQTTI